MRPAARVALVQPRASTARPAARRPAGPPRRGSGSRGRSSGRSAAARRAAPSRATASRMVGEARGHRLRRGQHVAVLPRRSGSEASSVSVVAQRHERVLQRRARARVRVDVAGGHARHPEPPRERRQRAVARAVVARERALQLDAQAVARRRRRAAGAASARRARRGRRSRSGRRAPRRARARAASGDRGSAAARVGRPSRVCACARVRSRQRLRQPRAFSHQQREVAPVVEVDLGAVDRPQPERRGGLRELHRARDASCGRSAPAPRGPARRAPRQLVGQRGAVEERVGRVAVQLDVRQRTHVRMNGGRR